jgi:hypothetical protein
MDLQNISFSREIIPFFKNACFFTNDLTCFVGTSESHLTHIPTLLIKSTEREENPKYRRWR